MVAGYQVRQVLSQEYKGVADHMFGLGLSLIVAGRSQLQLKLNTELENTRK